MHNFNCYIKPHGKFQTELKVKYPVSDSKSNYRLELYLFSPKVLSVDRKNYGVKNFLTDLRIMTRISTPDLVFSRITDSDCKESPLLRIRKEMARLADGRKGRPQRVLYELRTLSSIVRVQMRKNRDFLTKKIDTEDPMLLTGWLNDFADQLEKFLDSFRKLNPLFIGPEIDEQLNLAFDWTDESISLNVQREVGMMLRLCSDRKETAGCYSKLSEIIEDEIVHRESKEYLTGVRVPDKRSIGEMIVYRENVLKKWSQSAMYLNVKRSRAPARVGQIIAGAAAAAAMTFAVVATILTNQFFPANSTAWALAAVIAYIFKDRIKETLRSGLKTLMPSLVPDRMVVLKDASVQKRCGMTKSFVEFMSASDVPEHISAARGLGGKPFLDFLPAENVIRYRHDVALDGRKFFKNHERMESVTEIIRLELHKFMQLMDDPDQVYFYTDKSAIKKKRLRRVYHLNIIVAMSDRGRRPSKLLHYRIVLNRDGIVRIEKDRRD